MSDSESGEEVQVDLVEAEVTVVAQEEEEEEEVPHGTLVEILEHITPGATLQGMPLDVVIGRDVPANSHIVSAEQTHFTNFRLRRLQETVGQKVVQLRVANEKIQEQKQQLRRQKDYYKKQMKILRRQIDHPDHNITKSRLRK